MPWYVAYTKPRNEKKVAATLQQRGIAVYCPVQEEIRQWSDRKKKISEPVFRSYIFIELEDYTTGSLPVLETPGVVSFVWWNKKPGMVRGEEIQAIKDFLTAYRDVKAVTDIKKGDTVTVQEGPLKDMGGVVKYIQGNKAYLTIGSLGISLVAAVPVRSLDRREE
ncbi:MAG: UpxY family transcription antiterminator [Sphingobacteriales bacterium]|nr:MAG: UpxY family transcription antiterminator [Sphingobacteriales bacterium]